MMGLPWLFVPLHFPPASLGGGLITTTWHVDENLTVAASVQLSLLRNPCEHSRKIQKLNKRNFLLFAQRICKTQITSSCLFPSGDFPGYSTGLAGGEECGMQVLASQQVTRSSFLCLSHLRAQNVFNLLGEEVQRKDWFLRNHALAEIKGTQLISNEPNLDFPVSV